MDILLFILLGGIAGWIASKIMATDESMGLVANIVVGMIGAVIGGLIFNLLGGSGTTGFNIYSLLVAIIGSIILLWLVKQVRRV